MKGSHILLLCTFSALVKSSRGDEGRFFIADDLTAVESRYKVDAKPSPYVPPKPAPDYDYFAPTLAPTLPPPVSSIPSSSPVTPYFTPTTLPTESPSTTASTTASTTTTTTTRAPTTSSYRKLYFPTSFKPLFLQSRGEKTTTTSTAPTTSSTTTTTTASTTNYVSSTTPSVSLIPSSVSPFASFNEIQTTREPSPSLAPKSKTYIRPLYTKNDRQKSSSVYYKVKKIQNKLRKIKKVLRPVAYTSSSEEVTLQTTPSTIREESNGRTKLSNFYALTKAPKVDASYEPVALSKKSIKSLITRKSKARIPNRPTYRYSPTTPSTYQSPKSLDNNPLERLRTKVSHSSAIQDTEFISTTTASPSFVASTVSEALESSLPYSPSPVPFVSTTALPYFASTTANEISYTSEPKRIRSLPLTRDQARLYSSIPSYTTTATTTKSLPPRSPQPVSSYTQEQQLPLTREQSEVLKPFKAPSPTYKPRGEPGPSPIRRASSPVQYRGYQALNEVHREEKYPAQPYSFSYDVKDEYSGTDFNRAEESSGPVTKGSYKVALPDGRVQIVRYVADENGYKATVSYEGEAVFPSPGLFEEEPVPKRNFRHSRKVDTSSFATHNYSFLRNRDASRSSIQETTLRPVSLPVRHRVSRAEVKSLQSTTSPLVQRSSTTGVHSSSQSPYRQRVLQSQKDVLPNLSTSAPEYSDLPKVKSSLRPVPIYDSNYDEVQRDFGIKVDY